MSATDEMRQSFQILESELKKLGKELKNNKLKCPFHEDNHPSASVYKTEKGVWMLKCHVPSCGFIGDVFDIQAKTSNKKVGEILSDINHPKQEKENKPKRVFKTVAEIVESVGKMGKVEAKYEYANPDTGKIEMVVIRWHDGQHKSFLPHRAVDGGFVLGSPDVPRPIYNRKRVRDTKTVVVVEGEKCVHALHSIGIVATTSPGGADNAHHADWSLLAGKKVYIWPDDDKAGAIYATGVITMLDQLRPPPEISVFPPESLSLGDKGDAADFIAMGHDASDVWCILKEASEPAGIHTDLLKRLQDIISGRWAAIDWPWEKVSEASKALFPGTITILCGDPAASKSFFLLQAMHFWHKSKVEVAVMELEDDRAHHLLRLLAILSGRWDVLDDKWGRANASELQDIYAQNKTEIDSFATSIYSAPLGQVNYAAILTWIEERCAAGAKIIGIDPVTAIYTGESRQIEDLTFIVKAASILRKYESRLILVTHPRMGSGRRTSTTQDDIAGGRAFSRHTQNVFWLHRHDPSKRFNCIGSVGAASILCNRSLHIPKARNGPGHGWKIAFSLNPSVQFIEHGVISSESQGELPESL